MKIKEITSRPLFLAFIISFVCLFLFSPDSYTRDLFGHYDSAWFFTSGKAWMNGMLPYIDFADSKGPLLWLIYGIGYLISPQNYIGVFWLSVLLYTGIFYYIYCTARIFLNNHKLSIAVVLLMTAAYFCAWYHTEIRAEDWCSFFIAQSLYYVCHLLFESSEKSDKDASFTCFILGIGLAGTLLIKFNMTIMLCSTALYVLYFLICNKNNIPYALLSIVGGFSCIVLPFILYMHLSGNLNAFVQEYFFSTIQTVQSYNNITTYIHEWLFLTYDPHYVVVFTIGIVGAYFMGKYVNNNRFFFLFSFLGFYAIAIHHSSFLHWHYLCACMFFMVWSCIAIAKTISSKILWSATSVIVVYTLISNVFSWAYVSHTWFFANSQERKGYYEAAYYISQIKHPTILFYHTLDNSQGVPSECLPATKYWALQSGATETMIKDQEDAIKNKKADFVITAGHDLPIEISDSLLSANGYNCAYKYTLDEMLFYLYSKHNLQDPPPDFQVSKIDILFKKNVILTK